jgi:hypothetical protein
VVRCGHIWRVSQVRRCRPAATGYAVRMADTDPVTAPDTDPAYAQGDQDAEPTMTAPPGQRPDAASTSDASDASDASDEYADKPDAEGAS